VWLLMPQTFMNRSGQSVAALARFYRIAPAEILVVHDELDIPPGQLRLKFGGGLGGHNGLKDITAHLGTQDFWRLRVGIGHPGDRNEVVNFVLKPPRREESDLIDESIDRAPPGPDGQGRLERRHPAPQHPPGRTQTGLSAHFSFPHRRSRKQARGRRGLRIKCANLPIRPSPCA
jgi:hypothetical protein